MGGEQVYFCIDMKSFYASVECAERELNPFETNLVVADESRGKNALCLAISPRMKALGIRNRCRLSEIPKGVEYITALPRMQLLKFWWLIQKVGYEGWSQQAEGIMESTAYLDEKLTEIGWPHWVNDYSNTVFFKRPSQEIIDKYLLAGGYDERFGGDLSHIVVMQQVNKDAIDMFVADLKNEI